MRARTAIFPVFRAKLFDPESLFPSRLPSEATLREPSASNRIRCKNADVSCDKVKGRVLYRMVSPTKFDGTQDRFAPQRLKQNELPSEDYGLHRGVLSPMETLAQYVSTLAPPSTPAATIPLVCALAGNGTWLAYVLATIAILLVAWCVGRFARYSSSPGSLYSYASMILPAWLASIAAWSLLLAYVATASSVIAGLYQYATIFVGKSGIHPVSAVLISLLVTGACDWVAWLDVKISARLMLWIEAVSVSMIVTLVALVLVRHGFHIDSEKLT